MSGRLVDLKSQGGLVNVKPSGGSFDTKPFGSMLGQSEDDVVVRLYAGQIIQGGFFFFLTYPETIVTHS